MTKGNKDTAKAGARQTYEASAREAFDTCNQTINAARLRYLKAQKAARRTRDNALVKARVLCEKEVEDEKDSSGSQVAA